MSFYIIGLLLFFGMVIGTFAIIFTLALCRAPKINFSCCTNDCNQGRNCNCGVQ
jgi:hypothetical protein